MPFASPAYMLSDPTLIKDALSMKHLKALHKGAEYPALSPLIGTGLLSSDEEHWQKQRKICELGFSPSLLKNSVSHICEITDAMMAKLSKGQKRAFVVDVRKETLLLSAEILGKTAFGCSFGALDAQRPEDDPVYDAFRVIMRGLDIRARSIIGFLRLVPNKENRNFGLKLEQLNSIVEGVLKDHYQNPKLNENCLLAKLTECDEDGNKLSKSEILDNIKTFLFAGHDTTGSALAWILYYLAAHPAVQQKVKEEVDSVLVGDNMNPSYENLREKMPYINAVVKEVLRLHPSAGFSKIATADLILNGGGGFQLPVKAGCSLIIIPYFVHRNPKYWGDDASEFIPERWLKPKIEEQILSGSYFPFSLGHRGCIGMKLATLEMVCTTAKIVHQFELALTPETKKNPPVIAFEITMHPTDFTVDFVRR